MNNIDLATLIPEDFSFITLTTYRKRNVFINESVNSIVCEALSYHLENNHITAAAYVVMPNHLHIIASPAEWTIPEFVNNYKTYTGAKVKAMGGFTNKVWRRRFFDEQLIDEKDMADKIVKIHNNPINKKIVKKAEEYDWSSASNYVWGTGIVKKILVIRL